MTTYKLKSSANRAAKKSHGDNWASLVTIDAVEGGFVINTIEAPAKAAPKAKAKAPAKPKAGKVEAAPVANVVAELQAGLKALQAAKPESKATATPKAAVPIKATPAQPKAASAPVAATPISKKSAGRPISDDQVKVRRRLQAFIEAATGEFTVKSAIKALKLKKMHVSNGMRWALSAGLVERIAYKDEKRPGRKEWLFKRAVQDAKAAA